MGASHAAHHFTTAITSTTRLGGSLRKWQRTRITIETSERLVIKPAQTTASANCSACGQQVQMVTPEQAVTLMSIRSRTVYKLVEAQEVHFMETQEGHLLICLNSLTKRLEKRNPAAGQ
jgi:hypothetical protein